MAPLQRLNSRRKSLVGESECGGMGGAVRGSGPRSVALEAARPFTCPVGVKDRLHRLSAKSLLMS